MTLEELVSNIDKALTNIPKEIKTSVQAAGDILEMSVKQNLNSVNKVSGNLKDSCKRVQKDGYVAIRPDFKKAPHTHLVENGHRVVVKTKDGRKIDTGKLVAGQHMYRNALLVNVERLKALSSGVANAANFGG